ncbi:MAG: cysteine hydrolase family protein [Deinococcota bacterium]|jgi:nicotinamidase-related amidase|nr:cysteine hydrolase family protein [Deinococcota bacterium]
MTLSAQATEQAALLTDWLRDLSELKLSGLEPERTALASVDLIEGFCRQGPLSSPRVAAVIPEVVGTIRRLGEHGLPDAHIAFIQDSHPEDAQEFEAYPPHCVEGTIEAEAVSELQALPRWSRYRHFKKNSIASHSSAPFRAWLEGLEVTTIVAVGVVTDLCLYTLALHLQTHTLAHGLGRRIVVPESCTQTWDAPDHPGDLYHALFLHQLARNGVEVVKAVS